MMTSTKTHSLTQLKIPITKILHLLYLSCQFIKVMDSTQYLQSKIQEERLTQIPQNVGITQIFRIIHQQINSHNEQPIVINQQQQICEQFSLKEIVKLPNENEQNVEQPKNFEIISLIHQKSQNIMPQSIKIHNQQKVIQLIIFLDQNELNTINKSQDSKQRKQQPSVDQIEQKRFYTLNQNQQKSQQQQEDTLKDRSSKELSGHSGESVYNQVVKINTLQQQMKKGKENTQIDWTGSLRNKQNILEKISNEIIYNILFPN
ncbi:unnamed protein product [Paramecium primaurelia]|uniref:Uncharacterized protein n=1 Tax=Paramecium primaurelia TaxID=5886 RepID=A0A8S1N1M8_PARPR|nr:unnamed protein product [Paramecium primaurelia]